MKKSTILFSIAYILINAIQLVIIFVNKSPVFIRADLKNIYYNVFSNLTPRKFLKLYKVATLQVAKKDEYLTVQNTPVENLMTILEGSVNIIKDNNVIATSGPGFFIGEMSFLSDELATASVITNSEVKYLAWNKDSLLPLEKRDPALIRDLENAIALNLIKKLELSSAKVKPVLK